MPVTMQQVRAALEPEEPDYPKAARMGAEALPHLEDLVGETDGMLASKATYLASLIDDQRSSQVIKKAAESDRPEVRVAAAHGARNLPEQGVSDVLIPLLNDRDVGVRKTALKAVPDGAPSELRAAVDSLTDADSSPGIRELSSRVADRVSPAR